MVNEYIEELSHALSEHHAALMVGAGFSKNAQKISKNSKSFLTWTELSDVFLRKMYRDEQDCKYMSTLRLAQEVEDVLGRPALERMIQDALPDLEYIPGKLHVELLALPWSDVFTTNYDTLLERATEQVVTRRYNQILNKQDLLNSRGCPRIVKLHGSFPSQKPFIITEQDFRTYPREFAPFVNTVQQALIENVFCLIGFSCDDPNFLSWIGWIRDNLGKQNMQKMYMVSVSSLSIAKVRYLEDKNINVIDLSKLLPEETAAEARLQHFFDLLRTQVEKRKQSNNWFDGNKINLGQAKTLTDYCDIYREVCTVCPGWVFMPYKYRNRTEYLFSNMESLKYKNGVWAKADSQTKFEFSYWFTKFCSLSEQPLIYMYLEPIYEFISQTKLSDEKWWDNEQEEHRNDICLELLRGFREHYDEVHWKDCLSLINEKALGENQKQFLCVERLNWMFISFEMEKYRKFLEEWQISSGDFYYPLIKASFLVRIGEFVKAQNILKENLFSLRSQLNKNPDDLYLSSLEVCCVVLYNIIERHDHYFDTDYEEESIVSKADIDWYQERDFRASAIAKAKEPKLGRNVTIEYNLNRSVSNSFGSDKRVLEVISYWRFLEQTGSCLRIGAFGQKEGREESFQYAGEYYPHWTLMQMLVSGETKLVDSIYGRKAIALYTQKRVEEEIDNLLLCLNNITPYLTGHNGFFAKTDMYDCFANTLSALLSRLCAKCSLNFRDKILDALLKLNSLGKLDKLSELKDLFKELISGYTSDEQMERLEKFLRFPIQENQISCADPIIYLDIPKEKKKLEQQLYRKTISELQAQLRGSSSDGWNGTFDRYTMLARVVELNAVDREFLIEELKKLDNTRAYYTLIDIDTDHKNAYLERFMKKTIDFIKTSIEEKSWSADLFISGKIAGTEELETYKMLDFHEMVELFSKLLHAVEESSSDPMGFVRGFKKQLGLMIQAVLMANLDCIPQMYDSDSGDNKNDLINSLEELQEMIFKIAPMDIPLCLLFQKYIPNSDFEDNFWNTLWKAPTDDMGSLKVFISRLRTDFRITGLFASELHTAAEILSNRYMEIAYKNLDSLSAVIYYLIEMKLLSPGQLKQVDIRLERLCDETEIIEDDTEQLARLKIRCRVNTAYVAKAMYEQSYDFKGVLRWKEIVNSTDEFLELRRVCFERKCASVNSRD